VAPLFWFFEPFGKQLSEDPASQSRNSEKVKAKTKEPGCFQSGPGPVQSRGGAHRVIARA